MNNKIIIIGILICIIGLLNLFFNSNSEYYGYKDVSNNSPYYEAVKEVSEANIIGGYFEPDKAISRKDVVEGLYRLDGSPEVSFCEELTDVKSDSEYANSISWAVNLKIVTLNDKKFKPDDGIQKQHFVLMLYKYANYKQKDTSANIKLDSCKDKKKVDDYCEEPMKWAIDKGIVKYIKNKSGEDCLYPKKEVTRGEAAQMFAALMKLD